MLFSLTVMPESEKMERGQPERAVRYRRYKAIQNWTSLSQLTLMIGRVAVHRLDYIDLTCQYQQKKIAVG